MIQHEYQTVKVSTLSSQECSNAAVAQRKWELPQPKLGCCDGVSGRCRSPLKMEHHDRGLDAVTRCPKACRTNPRSLQGTYPCRSFVLVEVPHELVRSGSLLVIPLGTSSSGESHHCHQKLWGCSPCAQCRERHSSGRQRDIAATRVQQEGVGLTLSF